MRTVFASCLRQLEILKENQNCSIRASCLQASCWTSQEAPNKTKTEASTILSSYEICIWFGFLVISSFPEKQNEPFIHMLLPSLPPPSPPSAAHHLCAGLSPFCHQQGQHHWCPQPSSGRCAGYSTHPATAHCAVRKGRWGESSWFLAVLSC